jgi:2-isopropylmalate synthase
LIDLVRASAQAGYLVLWEEVARDGAQHKTLLSGTQRVAVARATSALFGGAAANHLIFAAGFPSICREEFEAIRELAAEIDTCHLVTHGRATREDIDRGLAAIAGARYGRVSFFVPVSERMSEALLHVPARRALAHACDLAAYAVDHAVGVPIDVALADATRAEPGFVAEAATLLTEAGVRVVKICDTVGDLYPRTAATYFRDVREQVAADVVLGVHLHNDYGLALANNLEAVTSGLRIVAGAWLGLGERNGLAATEQLLLALALEPERRAAQLGLAGPLWIGPPDLRAVVPLVRHLSTLTGVPLKGTDPHVGTQINTISTGTPFADPELFQPYDPDAVLGVPRTVVLTQLANTDVIRYLAATLGYVLDRDQAQRALDWVKVTAYHRGTAVFPLSEYAAFLAGLAVPTSEMLPSRRADLATDIGA